MKKYLLIVLIALNVFPQTRLNSTGYKDTSMILNFYNDTLLFSKKFNISNAENKSFYVIANDSSAAGFSSDSVYFEVGYQLGWLGKFDDSVFTRWSNGIVQDTFTLDSIYDPYTMTGDKWSTTYATGAINPIALTVDTTSIPDWIYQWYTFSPPWAHFIRFFAQGIAGNKEGSYIPLMFGLDQRDHQETR